MAFIAPIAAMLVQMGISRSREYLADEAGARDFGHPEHLAQALKKLEDYSQQSRLSQGSPATGRLFIVNPFFGLDFSNLFSTHPKTVE
jgi:heat shock protein HtpX